MLRTKRTSIFLYSPDPAGGGDTPPAGTTPTGGGGKIEFTAEQQAHIDKLLGDRAKRAGQITLTEFFKTLGVENADELKAALDEGKKLKSAQLSDLEKAQQAAKDAQAKIDAAEKAKADALAAAQTKLLRAAVIAEAVKQNFDEAEISSVWLALQGDKTLLEAIKPKDDDFEGVDKAIETIAKAHPKWLKSADGGKTNINAQNRSGEPRLQRAQREQELRARFGIKK